MVQAMQYFPGKRSASKVIGILNGEAGLSQIDDRVWSLGSLRNPVYCGHQKSDSSALYATLRNASFRGLPDAFGQQLPLPKYLSEAKQLPYNQRVMRYRYEGKR
jgi:hypothetical protein